MGDHAREFVKLEFSNTVKVTFIVWGGGGGFG